jgi:hypothetical protein
MSEEDIIIFMYCSIEDLYEDLLKKSQVKLRRRVYPPKLSDAEVIRMEIVVEYLKLDTDKGIWEYFKKHYLYLFPKLGSRVNFVKQATNMWKVKQKLLMSLSQKMDANSDTLYITDGFPIPVCLFARARQSKNFNGIATYSYCAAKKQTYYGFNGIITINSLGCICGYTVTKSNVDERLAVWDTLDNVQGLLIGDKGFITQKLKHDLIVNNICLETPKRKNMLDTRSKAFIKKIMST